MRRLNKLIDACESEAAKNHVGCDGENQAREDIEERSRTREAVREPGPESRTGTSPENECAGQRPVHQARKGVTGSGRYSERGNSKEAGSNRIDRSHPRGAHQSGYDQKTTANPEET